MNWILDIEGISSNVEELSASMEDRSRIYTAKAPIPSNKSTGNASNKAKDGSEKALLIGQRRKKLGTVYQIKLKLKINETSKNLRLSIEKQRL